MAKKLLLLLPHQPLLPPLKLLLPLLLLLKPHQPPLLLLKLLLPLNLQSTKLNQLVKKPTRVGFFICSTHSLVDLSPIQPRILIGNND